MSEYCRGPGARPDISPVGGDSVVSVVMEIMGATVTCATLKSSCAATLCSLARMESMWSQLPLCATSMPRKGMKMMLYCGTHGDRGRPPSRHWIPRPWDGEICLVSGGQRLKRVVKYGFVTTTLLAHSACKDSNVDLDKNDTRRIVETTTVRGEEWLEDVTTALPYLDIVTVVRGCKGCKEIYLDQDEVLLRVHDLPVDMIPGRMVVEM
ncbi:hypothetical protein BGY98DRAFT_283100 [Russula aff. rugulosa BPL654]|nr:hypothetical protein BGY98DRAFT_283100 [Russula aff. rugulosa BPL654]